MYSNWNNKSDQQIWAFLFKKKKKELFETDYFPTKLHSFLAVSTLNKANTLSSIFSYPQYVPQFWASPFKNKILILVLLSRLLFDCMHFKFHENLNKNYSFFPMLNSFSWVTCLRQGSQHNETCVWLPVKRNTAFLFLSWPVPQPNIDPWGSVKFPHLTYFRA